MYAGKWWASLLVSVLLSGTALAQDGFPQQEFIDEWNKEMVTEVQRQSNSFDEDGLRAISINLTADRPALKLLMAVASMVSDEVIPSVRETMIEELYVDHFGMTCDILENHLKDFADIQALRLHFLVVSESRELLYDEEQTCTVEDL